MFSETHAYDIVGIIEWALLFAEISYDYGKVFFTMTAFGVQEFLICNTFHQATSSPNGQARSIKYNLSLRGRI